MDPDFRNSHIRSILKSISFRVLATIVTMVLVYIYTNSWTFSLGIGMWEVVTKLILFYVHERWWETIALKNFSLKPLLRPFTLFLSLFLKR